MITDVEHRNENFYRQLLGTTMDALRIQGPKPLANLASRNTDRMWLTVFIGAECVYQTYDLPFSKLRCKSVQLHIFKNEIVHTFVPLFDTRHKEIQSIIRNIFFPRSAK